MIITGIFHVAIKTADLEGTIKFYRNVLGMRLAPRPNFETPGAWLACSTPDNNAIIHLYGGRAACDETGKYPRGTATIDHVSLTVSGYRDTVQRIKAHGLDWREYIVPDTKLWQIFVYDPNGVQLELTFDLESGDRRLSRCIGRAPSGTGGQLLQPSALFRISRIHHRLSPIRLIFYQAVRPQPQFRASHPELPTRRLERACWPDARRQNKLGAGD